MPENDKTLAAEYIESGDYYLAARKWYGGQFHRPIAESRFFVVIIFLSLINGYYAFDAFFSMFPITASVPFITYSDSILDDLPTIHPIATQGEDNNTAVMKYLLKQYVENRESYKLPLFEQRFHNIWGSSSGDVFAQYQEEIAPSNSHSPYRLYGSDAMRDIHVESLSYQPDASGAIHARIIFTAQVKAVSDSKELSHSKWEANITYQYIPLTVEQRLEAHADLASFFGLTGTTVKDSGVTQPDDSHMKVTPMKLTVTGYQVKELLE